MIVTFDLCPKLFGCIFLLFIYSQQKKVLHINKNILLQGILSFILKPRKVIGVRKLSQETHAGGAILTGIVSLCLKLLLVWKETVYIHKTISKGRGQNILRGVGYPD